MIPNSSNNLPLIKRLSYKQAKLVMLVAVMLGFLFSFLQIYLDYFNAQDESEVILQQILNSTKQPAAQATYTFDSVLAKEVVEGLFKYPPIYKIVLLETSQNEQLAMVERDLLVSSWRWLSNLLFGISKHYDIELFVQETQYGILQVSVDSHLLASGFLERALIVLLSGSIRNILLAFFLLYLFHVVVTKPLFQITTTLITIDPNNPEKTRLPYPDGHNEDELGQLVAFTNKLLSSIDEQTTKQEVILHNLEIAKNAFSRFVPQEFLKFLNKDSIVDIQLGDHIEQEMTILFSDIRDFTSLSEQMTPQDNFRLINSYLKRMEPTIRQYNGFIDKYIGDAIMALFPKADGAVQASIEMLNTLRRYNLTRGQPQRPKLGIGIGIHTGKLMLGTIGSENRMDGTVIADAVNLAARLESTTKIYGNSLIISQSTLDELDNSDQYSMRFLDNVKVKGRSEKIRIFEVFDADEPQVKADKRATIEKFERAVNLYQEYKFAAVKELMQECLQINPQDKVAEAYIKRCQNFLQLKKDSDWNELEN